jgi:DNA modification methylase
MSVRLLHGDCREVLKTLPSESVHCVVCSPPYFGLRDYGIAGQIGLEATPDAYVAEIVAVFREVRRVLRNDGTLWLNLGDSYNGYMANQRGTGLETNRQQSRKYIEPGAGLRTSLLKNKDLIGIPWAVAFALRADGWYLRQDIIWSKPNPMPESVRDRCTKAHEYLFLLSKSPRYFFDQEAVREPVNPNNNGSVRMAAMDGYKSMDDGYKQRRPQREVNYDEIKGANKRSVWEVATQPFSEVHFAVFPPALIEPCILAGCPAKACATCGKPWVREVERIKDRPTSELRGKYAEENAPVRIGGGSSTIGHSNWHDGRHSAQQITLGFSPSCSCNAATVPGTCLDPFAGAGTTGLVADRLGRNAILIELNAGYADMSKRRITDDAPLFAEVVAA